MPNKPQDKKWTSARPVLSNPCDRDGKLWRLIIGIVGIAFTFFAVNAVAAAEGNFYHQHAIGWHWYNEKIIADNIKKSQEQQSTQPLTTVDPTKEMAAVRATIDRALNRAILHPTPENVASYLVLQNKISNQSTQFANVWQKVLLEHPELNYSLVQPTNSIAKQIYLDTYEEKESQVITQFFRQRGLFFFYSSGCPYCQKFAPIVKSFAARHGVAIIPVTLDGQSLPVFPNSRTDAGQARKFKVSAVPALFAVNPYTNKAIPIAYGFISESDLRQRILDVATDFKSNL